MIFLALLASIKRPWRIEARQAFPGEQGGNLCASPFCELCWPWLPLWAEGSLSMRFSERENPPGKSMLRPAHEKVSVFAVNPLADARWDELVSRHPRAGVFHTSRWLSALQRTYGYDPVVFTTSGPRGPLSNGLVFCKVSSWITGRRLVSLPFSDHCDVLANSAAELHELLAHVCECVTRDGYAHAEIRPTTTEEPERFSAANLQPSETFCLHRLSLNVPLDVLFHNMHRNCFQRKIQRAEREGLIYKSGQSELF